MNAKQLHYFLTAVQKGSIASAARALDVAQPAVSNQIATLEYELSVQLVSRSFKGISLTPAGEIFLSHAKRIFLDIELAKNAVKGLSQRGQGVVRVGMLPCIGNVLSMPIIDLQAKRYPGIQLDISTGPSYAVKSWLEDGKVDIALAYEQVEFNKNATIYPLINEYLYLVAGVKTIEQHHAARFAKDSISFWELSELDLLIPSPKDALGSLIHEYELKTGVALRHNTTYSGQLMTALRQVIEGHAMMILPSSAIFHLEQKGLVKSIKIIEPEMRRNVCAIVDSTHSLSDNVLSTFKVVKSAVNMAQESHQWRGDLQCI